MTQRENVTLLREDEKGCRERRRVVLSDNSVIVRNIGLRCGGLGLRLSNN